MTTTLRIKKEYKDKLEVAIKWYSLISILNDFKLTPMDIKLLAFTAVEGNISTGGKKEKFIALYDSSTNSVSNCICKLSEKYFLIKKEGKIKLHPQLAMDFNNDILVQINIKIADEQAD